MECIDRITVYYTTDNPHVQIELPSEAIGRELVKAGGLDVDMYETVELAIRSVLKKSYSPDIEPYVAAFTKRDRLSIGFRVRVIHADKVEDIASKTADLIGALVDEESCEVVVEQAPPEIAKYIIGA